MNTNHSASSKTARRAVECIGVLLLATSAAHGQTITSLGSLGMDANSIDASYAHAVNADGIVVVGQTTSPSGTRAFYWTPAGMQNLGVLPGGTYSYATGVSADGLWTVGYGNSTNGDRGFRYFLNGTPQSLGEYIGAYYISATGVSADGSYVSGNAQNFNGAHIFRWSSGGGFLGFGSNLLGIATYGISGDGSTVVGYSSGILYTAPIQWTQAGGLVALPQLVGGNNAIARAASNDGSVVCGNGNTTADNMVHAIRWEGGAAQDIGVLPGYTTSYATALHASGIFIAGDCVSGTANDAWIWTQPRGMVLLTDFLIGEGVNLSGWSGLHSCSGVSSDGTALVGTGTFQGQIRAFVVDGLEPVCGPWIPGPPIDAATCLDGTIILPVIAYSQDAFFPALQWQKLVGNVWTNLSNGTTGLGTQISGVYTYNLTLSTCNTDAAGQYRVVVYSGCASRATPPVTVAVNTQGANIIFQPQGLVVCPNDSASFSVTHLNFDTDAPFSYQWEYEIGPNVFAPLPNGTTTVWDGNQPGEGGIVSGANTGTMTIAADLANSRELSAAHYRDYRCVISNACGAVNSNPATLKVWDSCQQADMNGDGGVDFFDIDGFLLALFDPAGFATAYPAANPDNADCNGDGTTDFFDIDAFVACLFGACP